MTIHNYTPALKQPLADLMVAYFPEVNADIPEKIIRGKLSDLIAEQHHQRILYAAVAMENESPIGFSIFQIDTPESDWCKRPGWGFIREFYIAPAYRHRGFGQLLAQYSEDALRAAGAQNLYLTSAQASPFWVHCGWRETREICSNELPILEK